MRLTKTMNKKVMFEEGWGNLESPYVKLFITIYIEDEEYIYTVPNNFSCFIKINKRTKENEIVKEIPGEWITTENLYVSAIRIEDSIWFTPYNAQKIMVYDIKMNDFSFIEIPGYDKVPKDKRWWFFEESYRYGNYIYSLGANYKGILRIDTENKTAVEVSISDYNRIKFKSAENFGEDIYWVSEDAKDIFKFNITSEQLSHIYHSDKYLIATIGAWEEQLLFFDDKGGIYLVDRDDNSVEHLMDSGLDVVRVTLMEKESALYAFPRYHAEDGFILRKNDEGELNIQKLSFGFKAFREFATMIHHPVDCGDYFRLPVWCDKSVVDYDPYLTSNTHESECYYVSKKCFFEVYFKQATDKIISEHSGINIHKFLNYIIYKESNEAENNDLKNYKNCQ